MVMLKPPFKADNTRELYKKVMFGECEKLSLHYSQDLRDFVRLLMTRDQACRPSA